jgi:uncharacterized Zn-finger protein
VHDKKKPYVCQHEGCGRGFSQISNLIRHKRIHTGEKPFKCDQCDKAFASGSNLKQHEQTHLRQNNRKCFKCPYCDEKQFLYLISLKKHISQAHPGMKQDSIVVHGAPAKESIPAGNEEKRDTSFAEMASTRKLVDPSVR